MAVFLLVVISAILWLFPILAEPPFNYFVPNKDIGYFIFFGGIAVTSAIWGFRHPSRQKMPYVVVLLFAPLCHFVIYGGMLLPVTIVLGIGICVVSCMVGKGIVSCVSFHTEKPLKPDALRTFKTIFPLIVISIVLGLIPILTEILFHCPPDGVLGIVYAWGIPVASAIWGFRHAWHQMPYVFILPLASHCHLMIHPNEFWLLSLFCAFLTCAVSYIVGRGLAWVWQRGKK